MEDFNKSILDFVENNVDIMKCLYDAIRVVDPQKKKVLLYEKGSLIEKEDSCFHELNRNQVCENCISIRALNNKKTFMKIENIAEKIFMISAVPLNVNNKTVIIELIKDVTDTLFYGDSIDGKEQKVNNIINDMKKIATKDSLTGIYNRRYIDERLPIDMDKCKNNSVPISIIMADVDYFKGINDRFGHLAGDLILKEFTRCLKKCIRNKKDWVARYGGEEFLICVPGADEKVALKIAKRMHDYLISQNVNYENEEIRITASFGICTTVDKDITMEELVSCADQKLYEAKNSGRNRIVF